MVSSSEALIRAVWAASVPAAAAIVWAAVEAALRSPALTPSLKPSSRAWATIWATTSSGTPIGSGTNSGSGWASGAKSSATTGLAERGCSARSRSKVKRARAAMASGNHLVVGLGLDDDDVALGCQILGGGNHAALGLVDVLQAHRTHAGHVVLQHLGGAGRHVLVEIILDVVARPLEAESQFALVVARDQGLDR